MAEAAGFSCARLRDPAQDQCLVDRLQTLNSETDAVDWALGLRCHPRQLLVDVILTVLNQIVLTS